MAGYSILYKFIPLPPIRTQRLNGLLVNVVSKYGRAMKSDFEALVSTWQHNPGFKMTVGYRGGDLFASVVTSDDIFRYLDEGTGVRYATMRTDFVAKTTPGALSSGKGANPKPRYISRMMPRPGIQARNFSVQMRQRYEKTFNEDIKNTIMAELRSTK
jgi:hypothetical protein